jgi:hypothetical protein
MVRPKEKAKELFTIFYNCIPANELGLEYNSAKKCALIAVDEILNLTKIESIRPDEVYMKLEYWVEVKEHIKKI